MIVNIEFLKVSDLKSIDDLSRRYKSTIGFFTKETFKDYLEKQGVLGAKTLDGELAGYLLFASNSDRIRLGQLCVSECYRGHGIARRLVDALKASATTQKVIKLSCRRDFSENAMWPKLNFNPVGEKIGRSAARLPLTIWCHELNPDDELGLWQSEASADVLDVVIDAHIFYDFHEEDCESSMISKGLLHDFLVDSINFWVTDELFHEIHRQESVTLRNRSLDLAHGMNRVTCNQDVADEFTKFLQGILPYKSDSEKSDIHHIAKTAASEVNTFVTCDEKVLRRSHEIKALTGVDVVHPVDLITSTHEVLEKQSYTPSRVSGFALKWIRLRGDDCLTLDTNIFQFEGENKGRFMEALRFFLSSPNEYCCELLQSEGDPVAIRVLQVSNDTTLAIPLARISSSSDSSLFGSFLIADTMSKAVAQGYMAVTCKKDTLSPVLYPLLRKMDFDEGQTEWAKVNLCRCCDRSDAQEEISGKCPELANQLVDKSNISFDQYCAPLASDQETPCFLVPIKPSFAMGLIDEKQASDDLFGGNASVLLRWDNVYYRKKSCHKMLKAPGRILWYVSGNVGAIIGISHLDEVEMGPPKELFRKYQKFGVLEWRDLYSMCGKDVKKEIMALRFSRTFPFQKQISLCEMRAIFREEGIAESLQSPSFIPYTTLAKIFKIGFPLQNEKST